jgi:hypothetical protein
MATNIDHLSTNTPASEISSSSFDDGYNSIDLEAKSLDDILRNSPAAALLGLKDKESLPEEDNSVPNPDESSAEEAQEETGDESENDLDEEEGSKDSEEENKDEDDKSTQNSELPSEEDIDWEYKLPVTIDGKTEYLTLEEVRKGYSTDQHLSQKGRELGELKKQIEQERNEKLQEVIQLGTVINEELTAVESSLANEYHKLKTEMDKAKEDGDTYSARELRDKVEVVQEKYWAARNSREAKTQAVMEQLQLQQQEYQNNLLKEYNEKITTVIPDYNEKVALNIREFALKEGLPEHLLNQVYDPIVVKFINDYRKLKTAKETGEVKRKAAPTTKSIPTKGGNSVSQKEQQKVTNARSKVLSGQGSKEDELDFLKRISSISRKL